jgi:hypothetical protein
MLKNEAKKGKSTILFLIYGGGSDERCSNY